MSFPYERSDDVETERLIRVSRRLAVGCAFVALLAMAVALLVGLPTAADAAELSWRQQKILDVRERAFACQDTVGVSRRRVAQRIVTGGPAYRRWVLQSWRRSERFYCKAARDLADPVRAIRVVWGPLADEALAVAYCESRYSVHASNGQYEGLFQVSEHWRRTVPGFDYTALAQARHALRIYRLTGSTWAHWACRP